LASLFGESTRYNLAGYWIKRDNITTPGISPNRVAGDSDSDKAIWSRAIWQFCHPDHTIIRIKAYQIPKTVLLV
jgi:hypothetical protein